MSVSSYVTRHGHAFVSSVGRLVRSPLATFLTLVVIALALALPTGLRLFVNNANAATGGFSNAVDLSVYFKTDVPLAKAQQLLSNARARSDVEEVSLISSDQALEEFRKYSGFGAALEALQENPLPNVLHVRPKGDGASPDGLEALRKYFSAWPEVDLVQIDTEWVKRFAAILNLLRRILLIASIVLGIGVLAVIGNTIRLEILNRRAEIEVTKLVGGSNAFVRRPFLYTGMLYGVLGALLAWAIIAGAEALLDEPVATLARLYGSQFSLTGLQPDELAILLGSGVVLGWLGAWISAARHLRSIEPRA
jgi:cell division transport system permease protein